MLRGLLHVQATRPPQNTLHLNLMQNELHHLWPLCLNNEWNRLMLLIVQRVEFILMAVEISQKRHPLSC